MQKPFIAKPDLMRYGKLSFRHQGLGNKFLL